MELTVLPSRSSEPGDPWYQAGLRFTCTQCGNCCTGGPGYVWISKEEVRRLAAFLKITPQQTVSRYCRRIAGRLSLKEKRGPGGHDCVFLVTQEGAKPQAEATGAVGEAGVPLRRRGCSIYPVRPLQCRTWPFWPENLETPAEWDRVGRRCPGMGTGTRTFLREQIEELRDAQDWPADPPSSAPK